jgi:methylated-DNA-[protein]-cysteine S-methyltransferase
MSHHLLLTTPIGPVLLEYGDEQLRSLRFWPQGEHPPAGTRDHSAPGDPLGPRLARELREYFAGARQRFTVPVAPEGTAFQQEVWRALREIPCGETRSYGELARAVGRPGAARAVGQANARNPLPVLVPCHRVLAADGGIGGYLGSWGGGSGVEVKRWLLDHERKMAAGR